jgi:hypothetical protein
VGGNAIQPRPSPRFQLVARLGHRRARGKAPPHQTVRGSRQDAPPNDDGPKTNRFPRGRAPQKKIHLHGRTRSSYRQHTYERTLCLVPRDERIGGTPPVGRTSPLLVSVDMYHAGNGWIYARATMNRVETISPAVTAASRRYAWPDGVKELNN